MTASLDEVYFPSVVVCNVSPLRKSFMYSVMQNSAFMADRALVSSVWQLILVFQTGYQVLVFLVCLIGGDVKVIFYSLGIKQEFNVASQNILKIFMGDITSTA